MRTHLANLGHAHTQLCLDAVAQRAHRHRAIRTVAVQSEDGDARRPLELHELDHRLIEAEHDRHVGERIADAVLNGLGTSERAGHARKGT